MSELWYETSEPCTRDLLVGFYDLTGYVRYCRNASDSDVLALMQGYFALTGGILADNGGLLVKCIGDAGLAAFRAEDADKGVRAFLDMKQAGDGWLSEQGVRSEGVVKLHLGPVACGMVGAPGRERFDIYGKTVNTAALLESNSFAMSPQVFRALEPDTRKLFKKHTPPVTYIGVAERH